MKRTFVIDSPQRQALAAKIVQGLSLQEVHVVNIKPYKPNRSASQQGLQWLWNTDIGNFNGDTKNDAHYEMKRRFCMPILIRDDEEYAAMIEAVGCMSPRVKKEIVNMTSTTRLNLAQMAEYLTDMERHAAEFRIPLRHPDDYDYALGNKKRS